MDDKNIIKNWTNQQIIDCIIDLTNNKLPIGNEPLEDIRDMAKELKKRLQPRIKIEIRDWYYGFNYYHSIRVYIDQGRGYELIGHDPFSYGSISNWGYEETAYNLLVKAGVFPKIEGYTNGSMEKGLHWFITNELKNNRHRYDIITQTVSRKKDL